jgi:hypothetical protein
MAKPLTKEQYQALFNAPVVVTTTNGAEPAAELIEDDGSQDFIGYTKKFIKQDWQTVDIIHLLGYTDKYGPNVGTANWSEMGGFKTSTGLWYIDRKMREAGIENPAILIITSKGGKGTFLEAIPEILPEYTIINIETQRLFLYRDKEMLPLDKNKMKFVPKAFGFPVICLAHYDIFSRSNDGKFETLDDGTPIIVDGQYFYKDKLQADHIASRLWDIVWCDEFHRLKDKDARWTVNIKKIKTRYGRHGSTGTGFINRPDEIWSLLNWLDKKKYGSYNHFKEIFCEIDDWDGYARVVGCKPEMRDAFREIVRNIGVRRTLDEVMPHLKTPIFKPINVELNPIQRKMYDSIKLQLQAEDQKGTPLYAANVLSLLQRLRQICVATPEVVEDYYDEVLDRRIQKVKLREPSSKLDALMEVIEGLHWDEDHKEPLVVFSNFKDPLELFKARLDKRNQAVVDMGLPDEFLCKYIHLDVKDTDVERYEKWFVEFPKMQHRVFMSTLQLGGESINLTPARHVVFLDRSWSPKDNAQGIGRIRRPGQEGQPIVIHINADDTTDQYIEDVNITKQGWFNQIFGKE